VNAFSVGRGPLLLATACSLAVACSSTAAVNCPDDNPTCPSPGPTYQADVGPLIDKYCSRCHAADGGMPGLPLQSYDDVTATNNGQIRHVFTAIKSCRMPKEGEPQPTPAERTTILSWYACCEVNGGTCAR
jgi:uncharacterized membrane protein